MGAYSKEGILKIFPGSSIFLVVGHGPVEIFLLVSYFFDANHTSIRISFRGQVNFVT